MAIEIENVRFHYREQPEKRILNIPSWSLNKGDHALIHGSSGGGKSTLLSLLSGLFVPNEGKVEVLGQRLDQMTNRQRDHFRATHIGYVFQQFNLIPYLNAIDNLLLASQFSQKKRTSSSNNGRDNKMKKLLDNLNISNYDSQQPTRNLSIGQQQRVAIARALINKPEILIADEPTSSLDDTNKNAFMELLMPMVNANSMTLLFVSHDLSLSHHFERVESLNDINHVEGTF